MASSTKQLYAWLEEKGFLWTLEEPYDQRLAAFAGPVPVARMWYWNQRTMILAGAEPPKAPETAAETEEAFVLVRQLIQQRFP